MKLSEIEFASLLTYSPWGTSELAFRSKTAKTNLKTDAHVGPKQIPMSEYIAQGTKKKLEQLPFTDFFKPNTILIPTPASSKTKKDSLWVPERLAIALVKNGLGKDVKSCLERTTPVRSSHRSSSANRLKAHEHYDTMSVQTILFDPDEILLIDDIITRGATFLGAANKLADAFPKANICAFAAMRTISNPENFSEIFDPCRGKIQLSGEDTYSDCIE